MTARGIRASKRWEGTLFSILSLGATVILCGIVTLLCGHLKLFIAHKSLIEAIQSPNSERVALERYLGTLINPPLFSTWISAFSEDSEPGQQKLVQTLVEVTQLIRERKFELALERAAQARALLESSGGKDWYIKIHAAYASEIQGCSEILGYLREDQLQIETNSNKLRHKLQELRGLAQDFADLVSLTPLPQRSELDPVEVYKSGVLVDLPQLDALPDGIADLSQLKDNLDRIGGEVRLRGEDVHIRFKDRLENIRAGSLELRAEYARLSEEQKLLEATQKNHRDQFARAVQDLSKSIADMVQQTTQPKDLRVLFAETLQRLANSLKLLAISS